ncbi:hypothetical protein RSAG8_07733, partial [Rhizoctonia solani AG-8 WAC10335]
MNLRTLTRAGCRPFGGVTGGGVLLWNRRGCACFCVTHVVLNAVNTDILREKEKYRETSGGWSSVVRWLERVSGNIYMTGL